MQLPEVQIPLMASNHKARILTIMRDVELLLALPIEPTRGFDRTTTSDFTNCSLPLVSHILAQKTVSAFAEGLTRPMLMRAIPSDGVFFGQLNQASPHVQMLQEWQRAALVITGNYDNWLENNFDQKRRKEFKRQRKRLSEQGILALETLNQSSDFKQFVDDYLELEAKGWKGKRGTALNTSGQQSSTFHKICAELHGTGRLRFWILRLNGKAIAALFGVVSGAQAQIIKITYDEAFAKFSPGVQIVLDATAAFFAEPGLKIVDSCAIPNHPMINRIWRERLSMADVLIAPPDYAAWKFQNVLIGLKIHAALRALAKVIFLTLTRRKKS